MPQLALGLLLACLKLRVPITDFADQLATTEELQSEHAQSQVLQTLLEIIPHNPYYVKRFLSNYIRVLEALGTTDEGLYELYCEGSILNAQELAATQADLLEYAVGNGRLVKIRETPRIISGAGTTGLRTWEAALYLVDYLNRQAGTIHLTNKHILELGAGTGLVSLALLANREHYSFSSITVTDGNTSLLATFGETMLLNSLDKPPWLRVEQLVWGSNTEEEHGFMPKADVVLGADVTYDALVVPLLCETIAGFFAHGTSLVLIAATIRNLDTIGVWEKELASRFEWTVDERQADPHNNNDAFWFNKGTPEIRIYKISRRR